MKKNKIMGLIVSALIIFMLAACGGEEEVEPEAEVENLTPPEGMDVEIFEWGLEALDIADQHLANEIESSDAIREMESIVSQIENFFNEDRDREVVEHTRVYIAIGNLINEISVGGPLEWRDELIEDLGLDE